MNKEETGFQKDLAYRQIGATVAASASAVVMSMGIALIIFGASLDADHTGKNTIIENGWALIALGGIGLFLGPLYFMVLIHRLKKKQKISKFQTQSILFDEMYDGKDIELEKRGYNAYSVKKLRLTGEPLQYDYSVLKYVEENKMILVTEDPENYGGCKENNLPCIKLGQNPLVDEIIKEIESLKKSDS